MSAAEDHYKALFSYGHMRATYLGLDIATQGNIIIEQFIQPDNRDALYSSLLGDQHIFLHTPNTLLQHQLSPISRQCLWELHSGIMIRLLENITGLSHLLPDTHCDDSYLIIPSSPQKITSNTTNKKLALILHVSLDTGTALLSTKEQQKNNANTTSTLKVSYWQYPESTASATL